MSIEQLKQWDKEYTLGKPTISDKEYDIEKEKELLKNPNDAYFSTVGYLNEKDKTKLPYCLGSLKKIKPDGSFDKWYSKQEHDSIIITPKYDGVSVLVHYVDGKMVKAFLRGNSEFGQDITNKAKYFINDIKEKKSIWARGEILIDFLPPEYVTKRTAVISILRNEKTKLIKNLQVIFYEAVNINTYTEYERLSLLTRYGLPTTFFEKIEYSDINENLLIKKLVEIKEKYSKFEIDGIVITMNFSIRENVAYPKDKIAFKVNQKAIETTVKNIEWNISRTGLCKPVIIINTINIDGININRTTGFNAEYVKNNKININTKIGVVRSGDVIPFITDVYNEKNCKDAILPINCPDCNSKLEWKGVDLVCYNENCKTKKLKKLEFFIKSIGITGISKTTLKKLNVTSIKELYDISLTEILNIDGFGIKKAEFIINEINEKLYMSKENFLTSIGISGLGKTTSKLILDNISFDNIFETKDFSFINGIGDVISNNIVNGINEIKETYELLKKYGLKWKKVNQSIFSNKLLTLTGTAPIKRDDLIRILESKNCRVGNITKKVDFLVTNDINSNSTKAKKARKYNIPFMSYDELLNKLNIVE